MNKYKKAIFDIGKILFDGNEDDVWNDYEAGNACELICRKLYSLGLADVDNEAEAWVGSEKLEKYIEKSEK